MVYHFAVIDVKGKLDRYETFIRSYQRMKEYRLTYEILDPDQVSDDTALVGLLTNGKYDAIFTRLAFSNYFSLRLAELAHLLRSTTKIVLFTASTAPRETLLRLFDEWVSWDVKEAIENLEKMFSKQPRRWRTRRALEDALTAVLSQTPCFPSMIHYTSSTYEKYRTSLTSPIDVLPFKRAAMLDQDNEVSSHHFFAETIVMRDVYSAGQAGAQGPNAKADHMTFQQLWGEHHSSVNLEMLAQELTILRGTMRKEASESVHDKSVAAIAEAEDAAKENDGPAVMKQLQKAGKWAWEMASKVGLDLATEALKKALGL